MSTVLYTVVNGRVIAESRSGVRKEYVPDPLGSTVALLDTTQTQTDTFSYWPYGEVNARTGSTPTPFQFVGTQGYYQDSNSKIYVRERYIDVVKGRWMTQDPIGPTDLELNLYRYVGNNSITRSDRSGLQDREQCEAKWRACKRKLEQNYRECLAQAIVAGTSAATLCAVLRCSKIVLPWARWICLGVCAGIGLGVTKALDDCCSHDWKTEYNKCEECYDRCVFPGPHHRPCKDPWL